MQKYQTFTFVGYACLPEEGKIELEYSLKDPEDGSQPLDFKETLTFAPILNWDESREAELDRALFMLHMIGGISYYKTCMPETIEVGSGRLTPGEAEFWKAVYENGLGEFFYRNKIDFRGKINFPALAKESDRKPFIPPEHGFTTDERCLVPIGGGKDSLVTIKMLRKQKIPVTLLRIGGHPLITAQAVAAGLPLLEVKRALSPELFTLNEQGALNGHVPITAYLNMLAIVLAILRGDTAVVFSNERSASEGNVEYLGMQINHQWSKSLAFEKMLQEQVHAFSELDVFSLLRSLSELRITQLYSQFTPYLPMTTSCNANWRILAKNKGPANRSSASGNIEKAHLRQGSGGQPPPSGGWCGECPKCAFVFVMLAAFLPITEVTELFGKNLLTDDKLLPLFRELLGLEGFKPFECVGTVDETKAAFLMIHDRGDSEDTPVMAMFVSDVLPSIKNPKELVETALLPSGEHAIPERFQNIVASF